MLLNLALAPMVILLLFMYLKDKYEKEPLKMLFLGVLYGFYLSIPILLVDSILLKSEIYNSFPIIFSAFISSSLNEECMKFIFLFFLLYKNKEFNEPIDAIVYSVFISLGFAGAENIIYVLSPTLGGVETAISRAFLSVPAHGLFAITMGYFFSKWRYLKEGFYNLFLSLLVPIALHGIFNFILLLEIDWYLFIFIPYEIFLWCLGIYLTNKLLKISPFKIN